MTQQPIELSELAGIDEIQMTFEMFMDGFEYKYPLRQRADGLYESSHTHIMWEAFKASWQIRDLMAAEDTPEREVDQPVDRPHIVIRTTDLHACVDRKRGEATVQFAFYEPDKQPERESGERYLARLLVACWPYMGISQRLSRIKLCRSLLMKTGDGDD